MVGKYTNAIVAVAFIILAGFMIYWKIENYGWVIFFALLCGLNQEK